MKIGRLIICGLVLNCLSIPVAAQPSRAFGIKAKTADGVEQEIRLYKGSYALIVGEGKYNSGWPSLSDVPNDVEAIKNALKSQFLVETALDLTGSEIKNRISKFIDDYGYEAENRLLIYFAGHGYTLKSATGERERGYIVPIDAPDPTRDELGFKRKAIDDDTLRNYAKQIESKHALFVFDSCFSGMLVSRGPIIVPPVIIESVAFPVREFITSGAANQQVPAVSDFRRAFVRGIEGEADTNNDGFILASELAGYLRQTVIGLGKGQTPQHGKIMDLDLNRGEFVFMVKSKGGSAQFEKIKGIARELLKYDEAYVPSENMIVVRKDNRYGFINITGATSIPVRFEVVASFSEGLAVAAIIDPKAVVSKGEEEPLKYGFIDITGKGVIPFEYDGADSFTGGVAKVIKDGKVLFINPKGKVAIPTKYDTYDCECEAADEDSLFDIFYRSPSFIDGLASVRRNNKEGFIDARGREVIALKYDVVLSFSEGLAAVSTGEKWGYIDRAGREAIPFKYDDANPFSEGLATVQTGEKWGYVNKAGVEVIPPRYDWAQAFSGGTARVHLEGKTLFIDTAGKILFTSDRAHVSPFMGKFAYATSITRNPFNVVLGLIDQNGDPLTEFKFDAEPWCYSFVDSGIIGVKLNGKKGFIDLNNNEFFDF